MKLKKPEMVAYYECSSGEPVKTLPLWQKSELDAKLVDTIHDDGTRACVVDILIQSADEFVSILSLKETGRPNGARDKKPRKPRTAEVATAKAA